MGDMLLVLDILINSCIRMSSFFVLLCLVQLVMFGFEMRCGGSSSCHVFHVYRIAFLRSWPMDSVSSGIGIGICRSCSICGA